MKKFINYLRYYFYLFLFKVVKYLSYKVNEFLGDDFIVIFKSSEAVDNFYNYLDTLNETETGNQIF